MLSLAAALLPGLVVGLILSSAGFIRFSFSVDLVPQHVQNAASKRIAETDAFRT
jgi:hypothetical protein